MTSAALYDHAMDIKPFDDVSVYRRARLVDALIRTGAEDHEAFQEVYRLTSAKLFSVCLRICGERSAAEDVLQNVYVKVWRHAGAWQTGRSSPITWLATIARNEAIDWTRKQKFGQMAPIDRAFEIADPSPSAETLLLSNELSRHVKRCLSSLDPSARDAIGAAFFYGVTYAELSERRGVPLSTVKSQVRRGLAKMKVQLDSHGNLECRACALANPSATGPSSDGAAPESFGVTASKTFKR